MHVHSRRPTKKPVAKDLWHDPELRRLGVERRYHLRRGDPKPEFISAKPQFFVNRHPPVVTDSADRLTPSSRSPLSARGRTLKASGRGGRSGTTSWLYGIRTGCQRNAESGR